MTKTQSKPRAKFCWYCGRKLYQSKVYVERIVDNHSRILHKTCSEDIDRMAKGGYSVINTEEQYGTD